MHTPIKTYEQYTVCLNQIKDVQKKTCRRSLLVYLLSLSHATNECKKILSIVALLCIVFTKCNNLWH